MAPGTYCNVLKGELSANGQSCSGETVTVNNNGALQVNLGPWDAIAIHKNARISGGTQPSDIKRTVIFIQAQTASGQDMFVRGGIDHNYAASNLGLSCTASNYACAIPITHNNLINATTAPWKASDSFLDWYGVESGQNSNAAGSAMDWTTNIWPSSWGAVKTVAADGFGVEPLNIWGQHYWMLDVQMDCSKTVNGWFELKAYVQNGQGWEGNISQANTPYPSNNHFAQCGKINTFDFGQSSYEVRDF